MMTRDEIEKTLSEIRKRHLINKSNDFTKKRLTKSTKSDIVLEDGGPGSGPPEGNQNAYKGGPKETEKSDTKTSSGTAYPKTKSGVEYDKEILNICEHTAVNDGLEKEYNEVVSKLTDKDVVYQKDVDGKEFASIPHLASMVDRETGKGNDVQNAYEHAAENAKDITPDMLDIAKQSGVSLSGLENDTKGGSHVGEKIDRKFADWSKENPGKSQADYVKQMGDCVRYTMMAKNDDMASQVNKAIDGLRSKGYDVNEVDNKFVGKDGKADNNSVYRAIHIGASKNGQNIEVQIHSRESLAIKNQIHTYYEESRQTDTTPERKEELDGIMRKHWVGYTNPKNIESVKSFKR